MDEDNPEIILSPLSRRYTADGITVSVEIYRLATADEWGLEVVDEEGTSTLWTQTFPSDRAAWDEFEADVRKVGLEKMLESDEEPGTIH